MQPNKKSYFVNELKKSMAKNTNIQVVDNLTDNFRGYTALLRKIKQRVLIAQQRAIYAANEEMLRMYWDIGGMLQQSQDADGWGKKTLQRLSVDLKIEVSGDDYYIDILMYNAFLHRYLVIELKDTEFMPEYIGKLNFYCSAVDDILCREGDNRTIGHSVRAKTVSRQNMHCVTFRSQSVYPTTN